MIDDEKLDGLLQYCKKLDENGELAERIIPSVLIELITRLRQAEKDAARWRFLADSPSGSLTLRIHNSRCDQRDALIDEAMNGSNN
ncbi:MAG: hypothetical protein ACRCXB_08055 [Aeromonadaceae bacterium]